MVYKKIIFIQRRCDNLPQEKKQKVRLLVARTYQTNKQITNKNNGNNNDNCCRVDRACTLFKCCLKQTGRNYINLRPYFPICRQVFPKKRYGYYCISAITKKE